MASVKFSLKTSKALVTRAVLIVIVLQPLGLWAASIPEPVQSGINEEFTKQEKIFRRRGAGVPGGYTANRGLSDYAGLLATGFCDSLGSLGSSDRWLDIGAGEGNAILDYNAPQHNTGPGEKCGGSGPRARAVAISIEDGRTDKWRQEAARLGDDRLRYLSGKRLRHYSPDELGKFRLITDVYGGFTYSENLSRFVEKALSFLELGGAFYTVVPSVHLEDGKDKLGTWYRTELVDAMSHPITVCSWLKKTARVKVTCESKSDWDEPTELIKIQKVGSDVSVPSLTVVEYKAGVPPERRFQLEN